MTYENWKKALLKSIESHGFNKTYRAFGLSSAGLRNIVKGNERGDEFVGLQSWKRKGATLLESPLKAG